MVPMIHARATTGWRSWLGLRPSKAELLRKRLQAEMCVNFGQPVKIVLANPRGYAGKTTMAICLAGVLGVARGGGVCAFENHELRGTMSLRTVTNGTQRTTRDFIHNLSQMTPDQVRQADLSRYVRHQHAGNFDAMVTSRSFEKQLDGDEYRAASALLGRFYEVIVVDTANNEAHEAFQAAMEDATVLVVPTKWRPTHITPAAAMLNDMATRSPRHRLLVQNAVVVATNGVNEAVPGAREMALPMFSSLADTLIEIPARSAHRGRPADPARPAPPPDPAGPGRIRRRGLPCRREEPDRNGGVVVNLDQLMQNVKPTLGPFAEHARPETDHDRRPGLDLVPGRGCAAADEGWPGVRRVPVRRPSDGDLGRGDGHRGAGAGADLPRDHPRRRPSTDLTRREPRCLFVPISDAAPRRRVPD